MRRWLAEQERPILLAEYFLTATSLSIFLLRAEWETVRVHISNISGAELYRGYQDFRRQVVQYRNTAGEGWAALSRFITEPLAPYLQEGDLVLLVPHRALHSFPIHALPVGGAPLAARHAVAYAPACGLLPLCQGPGKGTGQVASCAAFGITYEAEAESVAALFGDRPFPADDLSPDTLSSRAEEHDIIHLSCHAYFDDSDPLGSGLYLRTGDMPRYPDPADILSARQIMPMNLRNELVTISACDTGAHREFPGDELVGLTRAFLHAGTPTVVASLWAVDAETTRDFMLSFYTRLRDEYERTGVIDKASALQHAQLHLMNAKGTRASYHWAPFIMIGDWR
jgi:CHAT domain-containing protein